MKLGDIRRSKKKVRAAAWNVRSSPGGSTYETRKHPRIGKITTAIMRESGAANYGATACFGKQVFAPGAARVLRNGYAKYKGRCGYGSGATPTKALKSALKSLVRITR